MRIHSIKIIVRDIWDYVINSIESDDENNNDSFTLAASNEDVHGLERFRIVAHNSDSDSSSSDSSGTSSDNSSVNSDDSSNDEPKQQSTSINIYTVF